MKIKNFTFNRENGGLEIIVRQHADNSAVIAELHVSEDDLYVLLASLDLVADLDEEDLENDVLFEDEPESEDSEDEEEA